MLSISEQIKLGRLICPISKQPLVLSDDGLVTNDGKHRYGFVNGVPILFSDKQVQEKYLNGSGKAMVEEYTSPSRFKSLLRKLATLGGDYRSQQSMAEFKAVIGAQPDDALCLSIGGGPVRVDQKLINLNIGLFPNVDVVGDAYALPYADGSVDAIYCEAVLEHLEYPLHAVDEMWRVLRPGGQLYVITPFMQQYHGYPSHFQNYTITGHERLFQRVGFDVASRGVCVGPSVALFSLLVAYVRNFVPTRILKGLMYVLLAIAGLPFRALDIFVNRHPSAYILASTTYVRAIKPESAVAK